MKENEPLRIIGFVVYCLLWVLSCSHQQGASGPSGTETTNGITLTAWRSDGSPAAYTWIHIRPSNYLSQGASIYLPSPDSKDFQTDQNGVVRSIILPPGEYRIFAQCSTQVSTTLLNVLDSNTAIMDTLNLQLFAVLQGQVALPPGVPYSLVSIAGTDIVTWTDSSGHYELKPVPTGILDIIAYLPNATSPFAESELSVLPGDTLLDIPALTTISEDLSEWKDSLLIHLDTRTLGLANSVRNFPLRIVLQKTDLPYASSNGADIRIHDLDGKALPFDIAKLDDGSGQFILYVLLDSIPAGDSLDAFRILSGRPSSFSAANSGAVFNSQMGWSAVWHFTSQYLDSNGITRSPDASSNHLDGQVIGSPVFSAQGAWFSIDSPSHIEFSGVPINLGRDSITFDAWVRSEGFGGVMLKRDPHLNLWDDGESVFRFGETGATISMAGRLSPQFCVHGNDYGTTLDSVSLQEWSHLVMTREPIGPDTGYLQPGVVRWYVNGKEWKQWDSLVYMEPDSIGSTFYVGGSNGFLGWIGNMSLSRVVRDTSWIKLDYAMHAMPSQWISIRGK